MKKKTINSSKEVSPTKKKNENLYNKIEPDKLEWQAFYKVEQERPWFGESKKWLKLALS